MRKICSIFLLFLFIIKNEALFAEGKKNALFISPDQIASPGDRIFLRVKLIAKSALLTNPISGERIEFIVEGKPIGVSLTGGDGIAVREFTPEREGNYRVKVRLTGKSGYSADEADMLIACWKKNRPIILIDIGTLTNNDSEKADLPVPAQGAAESLIRISKRYKIILYATDHEEDLSKRKGWLKRHSFQEAPLFFWRSADIEEELDRLVGYGFRLKFGISKNPIDAWLFSGANISSIILAEDEDETEEDLPVTAKKVKGWIEIEGIISSSSKDS